MRKFSVSAFVVYAIRANRNVNSHIWSASLPGRVGLAMQIDVTTAISPGSANPYMERASEAAVRFSSFSGKCQI